MQAWRQIDDAGLWHDRLQAAGRSALQQGWAYGQAVALQGHGVARFGAFAGEDCIALAQLVHRRLPFSLGLALLLRGPVWLGQPDAAAWLPELQRTIGWRHLVWQPDDDDARDRRAGGRRIWTGAAHVVLDLFPELSALRRGLDGKWRNMLKAGEAAGLKVDATSGGPALDWLIAEAERQRRERRYAAPHPSFQANLAAASGRKGALVLTASSGGQPIAAMLFLRHGSTATYQLGATTSAGRATRAHHRLLWEAVVRLKDAGCRRLDLGQADTVTSPGIARFKLGTGGEVLTLAGSYLLRAPWRQSA